MSQPIAPISSGTKLSVYKQNKRWTAKGKFLPSKNSLNYGPQTAKNSHVWRVTLWAAIRLQLPRNAIMSSYKSSFVIYILINFSQTTIYTSSSVRKMCSVLQFRVSLLYCGLKIVNVVWKYWYSISHAHWHTGLFSVSRPDLPRFNPTRLSQAKCCPDPTRQTHDAKNLNFSKYITNITNVVHIVKSIFRNVTSCK